MHVRRVKMQLGGTEATTANPWHLANRKSQPGDCRILNPLLSWTKSEMTPWYSMLYGKLQVRCQRDETSYTDWYSMDLFNSSVGSFVDGILVKLSDSDQPEAR